MTNGGGWLSRPVFFGSEAGRLPLGWLVAGQLGCFRGDHEKAGRESYALKHASDITPVVVSDFGEVSGGAAQVAILSARALAEQGLPVTFVYAIGSTSPLLQHPGIRAVRLDLRDVRSTANPLRAALDGIWQREGAEALRAILAEHDPRRCIVHLHQWTRAFSPSAIGAAADLNLPVVVSMHDYFAFCPNGNYHDHPTNQPCQLVPLSRGCVARSCDRQSYAHKLVRLARQVLIGRTLLQVERLHFIHVSRLARRIAEPFLPDHATHDVVPNPCLVGRLDPVAVGRNRSFVFIGRLVPEKGCVAFAAAARRCGVPAVFLGSGPEESSIKKANPDAEMILWGARSVVTDVLSRARAVVLPSIWFETSGLVALEALASGVPVIASDRVGAAAEVLAHGKNGFLVEPGDGDQLAAAIGRIARADDGEIDAMGREAFARYWREPHTPEAHASKLVDVYLRLSRHKLAKAA